MTEIFTGIDKKVNLKSPKCYYENKLSKYVDRSCKNPAVINGKLTGDYSLQTVLFESDFPECIEETIEGNVDIIKYLYWSRMQNLLHIVQKDL